MKKNKSPNIFSNQHGMGLIGALIAAAMVVTVAMTVAYVVSDQNRLSKKIEIAGSCQNIANSLVEYIKKDETSLFVSSYGPTPGTVNFPTGLDTTDDGIDRFRFTTTPIPMYTGVGGAMTLGPGTVPLPLAWKYYNHLNIKNSTNRLVALASSENFCTADGKVAGPVVNPTGGTRFFDNYTTEPSPDTFGTLTRPGFTITERNVEVDLAIGFDNLPCTARRLAFADLPDSKSATRADFTVRVTVQRGTDQEKSCEGTGTVQRAIDTTSALTLLQYDRTVLCAGTAITPAICTAPVPIQIILRTFKSNAGTACQQACHQAINSTTCALTGPGGSPDLFDSFNNTLCNSCLESEPGTAFLCRIGVKKWMEDNPNVWQPCENAVVHDFDGSPAGTVSITYAPLIAGNSSTQRTSSAILNLTGLRSMRGYVVDVRTIDTAGNVGPSFCNQVSPGNANNGSPSCLPGSAAHFSIIDTVPLMGSISDTQQFVAAAGQQNGKYAPALATITPPKYDTALNVFTGRYQCQAGAPQLFGAVQYVPAIPPNSGLTHTCQGTLATPSGPVVIPSAVDNTTTPGCFCDGTDCTARLPSSSTQGNYSLAMTAANACGNLPPIPAQNWCMDTTPTVGAVYTAAVDYSTTSPDFTTIITPPAVAAKPCGVATLCPQLDNSFAAVLGTSCTLTGWTPNTHSGCAQDPTGNFCAITMDPCGRYEQNNAPPSRYSTTLVGAPHTGIPATNQCFSFGGTPRGGNVCESGSYCTINGKCLNTCAKAGAACTLATECEDPSYGVTSAEAGGPTCTGNRCTCPTNNSTPAANDCTPKYCPALSSCTGAPIGSAPGATACIACSNWVQSGFSALCLGGQRTQTVSCPGTCCIGPRPPDVITCPDCVDPWGNNMPHLSSLTAYQTSTVACGSTCASVSETRTCNNGIVSGSFTSQSCTVDACLGCNLPWGGSIADGTSVTAYAAPSVACGGDCATVSETRTCTNGVLSGSAGNASCSVNACPPPSPGCWGCTGSNANCTPGPAAGCGYAGYLADGNPDLRGTPCPSIGGFSTFQRGAPYTCDVGVLECSACGAPPPPSGGTWQPEGSDDSGCNFESCCAIKDQACSTAGEVVTCCKLGNYQNCNQAVAGKRQDMRCTP